MSKLLLGVEVATTFPEDSVEVLKRLVKGTTSEAAASSIPVWFKLAALRLVAESATETG